MMNFGNGVKGRIMGYGCIRYGCLTIERVAYVEGLKYNLLSYGQFCDKGFQVTFLPEKCLLIGMDDNKVYLSGKRIRQSIYYFDFKEENEHPKLCLFSKINKGSSWLWHKRLAHLNFKNLNKLASKGLVKGLPFISSKKDKICDACEMGKSKRSSHKSISESSITQNLKLLHMDLCGPISTESFSGKKYILVIVDDFSRYTWVEFLRKKSETPDLIINFKEN